MTAGSSPRSVVRRRPGQGRRAPPARAARRGGAPGRRHAGLARGARRRLRARTDDSVAIARDGGVAVLQIAPADFGHGRTRNLGAGATTGDVIAFLTQDATPRRPAGWPRCWPASTLGDDVGAVYGPHRPRPDTSPMIARELDALLRRARASPDGGPGRAARAATTPWLSNVNAAYRRDCWAAMRFDDLPYSEDQAFGRAMLAAGWAKAYAPAAAVLHAHDYPPAQFARRYFDEYRGLRETVGHVERFRVAGRSATCAASSPPTARGCASAAVPAAAAAAGPRVGGAPLGPQGLRRAGLARARAAAAPVQRRLSLEGTVVAAPPGRRPPRPAARRRSRAGPDMGRHVDTRAPRYARDGPAPLLPPLPGRTPIRRCTSPCVIPPFKRGSGGHMSLFQILHRLERMGHTVSIWLDDELGIMREHRARPHPPANPRVVRPARGPGLQGLRPLVRRRRRDGHRLADRPQRRDAARTRARARLLHPGPRARLLRLRRRAALGAGDLHARLPRALRLAVARADGAAVRLTTSRFSFGHRPRRLLPARDPAPPGHRRRLRSRRLAAPRRRARDPRRSRAARSAARRRRCSASATTRRCVRRSASSTSACSVLEQLAWTFTPRTSASCSSTTNYSVIPQEMLACGLPCVELAGVSGEGIFGERRRCRLRHPSTPADRRRRSSTCSTTGASGSAARTPGIAWAAGRTWDLAAEQVEAGLRHALRLRLTA